MLCLDGLVKITDFGLAAFSRKLSRDPWTDAEARFGQLCARLEGGTPTYLSPEQHWLLAALAEVKEHDQHAFVALKDAWPVTPATSDLYQVRATFTRYARASVTMVRLAPGACRVRGGQR